MVFDVGQGYDDVMNKPPDPHHRHPFSADLIRQAGWLYHLFSLSFMTSNCFWLAANLHSIVAVQR